MKSYWAGGRGGGGAGRKRDGGGRMGGGGDKRTLNIIALFTDLYILCTHSPRAAD